MENMIITVYAKAKAGFGVNHAIGEMTTRLDAALFQITNIEVHENGEIFFEAAGVGQKNKLRANLEREKINYCE